MPLYTKFKFNFCSPKWFYLQNSLLSVCKRYVNESYYDILKIPESCTSKDVREAFINLSKKNHPDKHLNDPSMHERFIRINEAYSVLINPLARRAYDINLHQKKKLDAPKSEHQQQYTHATTKTSENSSQSTRSNYSSYTQGDPFTFHYQNRRTDQKSKDDMYYGVKGGKRVSNKRVLFVVVLVAISAVAIQLVTIRNSVLRTRQQTLERSRKYALIHAMAKEKAKLYGTDYQINLLKKSLDGSFNQENGEARPKLKRKKVITNNKTNNEPSSDSTTSEKLSPESCQKCKKHKRI